MIVIGAGYVGVEFAQMYGRYGTKVILLSRSLRIMKQEEPELSDRLAEILRAEGIEVRLNTTAIRAERAGSEKAIIAEIEGQEHRFQAEQILFAAGRVPRVDGLGLEQAGVEVTPDGIKSGAGPDLSMGCWSWCPLLWTWPTISISPPRPWLVTAEAWQLAHEGWLARKSPF